jgi:hypothetical protein
MELSFISSPAPEKSYANALVAAIIAEVQMRAVAATSMPWIEVG